MAVPFVPAGKFEIIFSKSSGVNRHNNRFRSIGQIAGSFGEPLIHPEWRSVRW
jgi:hypothetical protein